MQYQCLNVKKKAKDECLTSDGIVNRECERFKLNEWIADNFKCLISVQKLTAERDSDIRSRILLKLETESKLTLQAVAEECERIMNLKNDTAEIQEICFSGPGCL